MDINFINVSFYDEAKKDLKLFSPEISKTIERLLIQYLQNSKRQTVPKRFFPTFVCDAFQIWKYRGSAVKYRNIPEFRCFAVFVPSENFFYVHIIYPRKEYDKSSFKAKIGKREDGIKQFYSEKFILS
jgi:hypothetical protein